MGKECEPTPAQISRENFQSPLALVDENARIIVVCHTCGRILYSAKANNFVTTTVAGLTARDHGNHFSIGHHVSVVSGATPDTLEEILAVNKKPGSRPTASQKLPLITPEMYK